MPIMTETGWAETPEDRAAAQEQAVRDLYGGQAASLLGAGPAPASDPMQGMEMVGRGDPGGGGNNRAIWRNPATGQYYFDRGTPMNWTPDQVQQMIQGSYKRGEDQTRANEARANSNQAMATAAMGGIMGGIGLSGAGLLGGAAPAAEGAGLLTPQASSALGANAANMSVAPGYTSLSGALESAVGNAAGQSLIPGSLASGAAAASAAPGFMASLPALQAGLGGMAAPSGLPPAQTAPATPTAPPGAPPGAKSAADSLTDWIKANPGTAASLGLTAYGLLNKATTPEDEAYKPSAIDQSVVAKYGGIPGGTSAAGGAQNYQGFQTLNAAPSGLLQTRLDKLKRGLL